MKSIVVANWKMNPPTWREAKKLFEATRKAVEHSRSASIVVAPPIIFLQGLKAIYTGRSIAFAVQNATPEPGGAHTGETSLMQAKDAGASYALIGHAERRGLGETNEDTRKKVAATLALKMTPIFCVGESKRGSSGEHFNVVKDQLRAGFMDVEPSRVKDVIVVYEPLWTIGADTTMKPRDMHEMSIFIRKCIVDLMGERVRPLAEKVRILYGGSVNETNVAEMLREGDVHGLLVGRASEDGVKFEALLEAIEGSQ